MRRLEPGERRKAPPRSPGAAAAAAGARGTARRRDRERTGDRKAQTKTETKADLRREILRLRGSEQRLRVENQCLTDVQRGRKEASDRHARLYQVIPVACLALDQDGSIQELNAAAARLLRVNRDRARGQALRRYLLEEDRPRLVSHLERCRFSPDVISIGVHLTRDSEPPAPIELRTRCPPDSEGLWVTAMLDAAAHQQMADERRLADAARAACAEIAAPDQFLAMLSHELRTPLMPVLATISALRTRQLPPPEVLASMLEVVHRNVAAEVQMVDDLLDATGIQRGKMRIAPRVISIHEVVQMAVESVGDDATAGRVAVRVELGAERHQVDGDPRRLCQVVWHLLRNAIKFTPPGGRIDVRSWSRGSVVNVEVRDTGRGMDVAALHRLFRPLERPVDQGQASTGGLGLGLWIAKGVIELHGGRIAASSRGPGTGARFVIELPVIRPVAVDAAEPAHAGGADRLSSPALPDRHGRSAAPQPTERASAPAPEKPRILLVEDHPDTGALLTELLRMDGYQVQLATSAAAALAMDLQSVDVVLSDLGLPDLPGHELIRALRQRRPLPAIALSGYGSESDRRASSEAGFKEHLIKPVEWPDLVAAIARVTAPSA